MSSSNWRESENPELLFMLEKVQSHYRTLKDGAIYERDSEKLSLQGFCRERKIFFCVFSKIKNMLVFLHLCIVNRVCSLHSDMN